MTNNYPEWQKAIREAQAEANRKEEEMQKAWDVKLNEERTNQQAALAYLLRYLGLGEGEAVPPQEGHQTTRKIGDYHFYLRRHDSDIFLTISPVLIKETQDLLEATEVSWWDCQNNKYALDRHEFQLSEVYAGDKWKTPVIGFELQYKQNLPAFQASIADELDDIDQAVEKALEKATLRANQALTAPARAFQARPLTFGEELAYLLDKHINALISNERAEYNNEY